MTEKQLTEIYLQNRTRFDFAIDFISSNKHLKTNVDISFNANVLINKESAKEKIRLLFIDTLNAAGGSNLTRNGKASRYFNSKIETLENSAQLKIKDFYECFDKSINNIKDLYNYLRLSDNIVNFKEKKAALFIYKIHQLQTILEPDQKIFADYNVSQSDLVIPVDVVITLVLNKLLNLTQKPVLEQYKDFDLINDFFKSQLGDKFLLIEDFWFWGYFTTKGSGGARTFEFNDDKFYTANFIKPTDQNRKYFMDFLQILNDPMPAANIGIAASGAGR
jgi:hypothetical protein